MRDYKKIRAFQFADELVLETYKATKDFPKDESYGLTSQIRRAAVSIAANIVEGASRQHQKDYLNFLYIARASAAEAEYLLGLAARLLYLDEKKYSKLDYLVKETGKILYGLINFIRKGMDKVDSR